MCREASDPAIQQNASACSAAAAALSFSDSSRFRVSAFFGDVLGRAAAGGAEIVSAGSRGVHSGKHHAFSRRRVPF